MAFRDNLDALDTAMTALAAKKSAVDSAQAALSKAQADYAAAVEEAEAIHNQYLKQVSEILPRRNAGR